MISPECLEKAWVLTRASEMGCLNPVMLEKTIVALQLLGHLAESGFARGSRDFPGCRRKGQPVRPAGGKESEHTRNRFLLAGCYVLAG